MARFLAAENFNNQIVRGILRQNPQVDVVRVQDVNLSGVDDPTVLSWAAEAGRIVLTHDVAIAECRIQSAEFRTETPAVWAFQKLKPIRPDCGLP